MIEVYYWCSTETKVRLTFTTVSSAENTFGSPTKLPLNLLTYFQPFPTATMTQQGAPDNSNDGSNKGSDSNPKPGGVVFLHDCTQKLHQLTFTVGSCKNTNTPVLEVVFLRDLT